MKKRRTSASAEIDRRPPRRRHVLAEELRRIAREIVPVRPEVVVDDVEEDHQPVVVRGVDQRLEIVGRAVGAIRRERQHAVIAPVARAGKIVDRHQLDGGDAESASAVELALHAGEAAAAARHAARTAPSRAMAGRASPALRQRYAPRIDHQARAMHVVGLRARRRIGHGQPDPSRSDRRAPAPQSPRPRTSRRRAGASRIGAPPSISTDDLVAAPAPTAESACGSSPTTGRAERQSRRTTSWPSRPKHAFREDRAARHDRDLLARDVALRLAGSALSISSRVGTFGVGRRKTRSSSLGLRNSVRIGTVPSSFVAARRSANRRFSGLFQDFGRDDLAMRVEPGDVENAGRRLVLAVQEVAAAQHRIARGAARSTAPR